MCRWNTHEKIKEKGLVDKSNISGFIKDLDLDKKIATLATKAELKSEQDKIAKLEAFVSSYFHGKSHFEDDGIQNYLIFQPVYKYFRTVANTNNVTTWK